MIFSEVRRLVIFRLRQKPPEGFFVVVAVHIIQRPRS